MLCATGTILQEYKEGIKLFPLPCKRWSCPDCCEKRKSRLKSEAFRGSPNTFITLTVNPAVGLDRNDRARRLAIAWRKIRRRAVKGWGNEKIPFIAVFEATEEGEPHLHILARSKWIDQKWLSAELEEHIGAPIVDIRRIKSKRQAANYVAKYIGKDPESFEGCKRYWRSLDYFVTTRKGRWAQTDVPLRSWYVRGSIEGVIRSYERMHYRLEVYESESFNETWLVDMLPEILSRVKKYPEVLQLPSVAPPLGLPCGVQRVGQ